MFQWTAIISIVAHVARMRATCRRLDFCTFDKIETSAQMDDAKVQTVLNIFIFT